MDILSKTPIAEQLEVLKLIKDHHLSAIRLVDKWRGIQVGQPDEDDTYLDLAIKRTFRNTSESRMVADLHELIAIQAKVNELEILQKDQRKNTEESTKSPAPTRNNGKCAQKVAGVRMPSRNTRRTSKLPDGPDEEATTETWKRKTPKRPRKPSKKT